MYYENLQGLTRPEFPVIFRDYRLDPGGPEVRLHWHEGMELIHVRRGQCVLVRGTRKDLLQAGDTAVIGSGVMHRIYVEGEKVVYDYFIAEDSLWQQMGISLDFSRLNTPVFRENRVDWALDELFRQPQSQSTSLDLQRKGLLLFLLGAVAEGWGEKNQVPEEGQFAPIQKVIRYIEHHYGEALEVERLAEEAGYSKYYFCRRFRQVTGMTPVEYINRLRCERVRILTSVEGLPVTQAARQCGFSQLSHFYRTFRKYMGTPPEGQAE